MFRDLHTLFDGFNHSCETRNVRLPIICKSIHVEIGWWLLGVYKQRMLSSFIHGHCRLKNSSISFSPFLYISCLGFFKKYLVATTSLFITISLCTFLYLAKNHSPVAFFFLPTRMWELGSGCLLALISGNRIFSSKVSTYFSITGFLLILLSFFVLNDNNGVSPLLILPVLGTFLVIGFTQTNGVIQHFLSNRILVYIGKISYSLYIWHWPVIYFANNNGKNK